MGERDTRLFVQFESHIVETWMRAGWISPPESESSGQFSPPDVARAHLIHDLKVQFGVNDEGIDLILDLVDQIYGLRRCLRRVLISGPGRRRSLTGKRISSRRRAKSVKGIGKRGTARTRNS